MTDRLGQFFSSIIIYAAISLILLGLDKWGIITGPKSPVEKIVNPASSITSGILNTITKPFVNIKDSFNSTRLNADLERRLAEALVNQAKQQRLEEENKSLKKLLSSDIPEEWQILPASAIGTSDQVVLGLGAQQGIKVGNTVIDQQGTLVGTISSVSTHTSWVTAVSNSVKPIPASVANSNTQGVVNNKDGQILLEKVEQAESLAVGNTIITSGAEGFYPQGIVIGQLVEIESDPSDIYKTGIIDLLATTSDRTLFIVIDAP